ncbi:hypothetical protein [Acidisoma sp.]|uniref:hypothetical protein n=1 Tax=Acidisoma sp. TaxID=1872115 RepID=UPI003AFFAE39
MSQDGKQHRKGEAARPQAQSVDREPTDEPTPQGPSGQVDHEDGPKGHPTSDRFQTEQAHQPDEKDTKTP